MRLFGTIREQKKRRCLLMAKRKCHTSCIQTKTLQVNQRQRKKYLYLFALTWWWLQTMNSPCLQGHLFLAATKNGMGNATRNASNYAIILSFQAGQLFQRRVAKIIAMHWPISVVLQVRVVWEEQWESLPGWQGWQRSKAFTQDGTEALKDHWRKLKVESHN